MRITAIGVHSAFATGAYEEVVLTKEVLSLVSQIIQSPNISEEEVQAEVNSRSRRYYLPKWHSNFLIEFDMPNKRSKPGPYRLLLDAGGDIRHALKSIGLSSADIDGIYISHPHNDHIGGMEYLGLTTLFNPVYTKSKREWLDNQFIADKLFLEPEWWSRPPHHVKPDLFIHRKVLEPLKRAIGPGLDTLQGVPDVSIETYFDIHLIGKQEGGETVKQILKDGNGYWTMVPIFAMHVISSSEEMASYGISLQHSEGYNVLLPTDTQHIMPTQLQSHYRKAHRIYMDCETSPFPSGVHPHISDLINNLSPEIQRKCLLYHYDGEPQVPEGMFYGILRTGDAHNYPD